MNAYWDAAGVAHLDLLPPYAAYSPDELIVNCYDSHPNPFTHQLAADVYRVLTTDGWFVASDWLAGYDGEPSPEMQAYLEAEGLDFGLASAQVYRQALEEAGFVDIERTILPDANSFIRARKPA